MGIRQPSVKTLDDLVTRHLTHGSGELCDENHLVFIVPVTPSLNELMKWKAGGPAHFRGVKYSRHRKDMQIAVNACARQALGRGYPTPWAEKVEMSAVRCSTQRRRIDETNMRGGMKPVEDAIVAAGIVEDDNPLHVQ